MPQWVRVTATKPHHLSLILGAHMVEEADWLLQVVLRPHTDCTDCMPIHAHINFLDGFFYSAMPRYTFYRSENCVCVVRCIIFTVLILWGAFYLVKHKKSHVRRANSQWGRKPVIKWHLLWMLSVECVILCPASTANAKVGRTGLPKQVGTC